MDGYLEMVERKDYSTSEATLEVDAADYDMFMRLCTDLAIDPAHHKLIGGLLSKALEEGWGDKAIQLDRAATAEVGQARSFVGFTAKGRIEP